MKKILIFLCLFAIPALVCARADYNVRVLCYHNIVDKPKFVFDVSTAAFEQQMKYLKENGFETLKASELIARLNSKTLESGKKYAVITFDDGNDGFYRNGVPILEKYNLKATFYIYPSIIFAREKGRHKSYMRWKEIRELAHRKNFEMGSHAYYHPYMTKISGYELRQNTEKAKQMLKKQTGIDAVTFAYPFGSYNNEAIAWLQKTGFEGAFALETGKEINYGVDRFIIPRYMMLRHIKIPEFDKIVHNQHYEKVANHKKTKKIKNKKSKTAV